MKRLAVLLIIVAMAGCSSRAKPNANGSQLPSGTSTPTVGSSASGGPSASPGRSTSSAAPSVTPSTHSTSKPSTVAPGVVVPAAGVYHYTQSGSIQAGPFNFQADPKGTLALGAPVDESGAKRQQQERVYSSSWSQQQILLFRSTGVFIKSITTRVGSGAFVQEDTCTPDHPLKAIALPLVVNNTWSDQGTCEGRTVKISGKVLRTETYTVGGVKVATDVVSLHTTQTGSGYNVSLNLMMWIAPKYGLTVHSTTSGSGTAQGTSFKENLTETLDRLTPDA
jgi:hypothetical protein